MSFTTFNETATFHWVTPPSAPVPPTAEDQNKKLRTMTLDNVITELDNIRQDAEHLTDRAQQAVSQLRNIQALPAIAPAGKPRKRNR